MNREIKFRGISVESNNFIYGVPIISGIHAFIITIKNRACDLGSRVKPETVSQYTGSKDMNGVEIYEGDIVRVTLSSYEKLVAYVEWFGDEGYPAFDLHQVNEAFYFDSNILSTVMNDGSEVEVIGNIYENPELLKEGN